MSKMQEAFEALYVSMPANIKPDSNEWHAELMCRVFEAGYQAAIAAVKEGGPSMEIIDYHGYLLHIFPKGDCGLRLGDKLYKLPED